MSNTDVIVFVEGWSDRYFYDQLVSVCCVAAGIKYQIRTAREIGSAGDGKPALIALFKIFKRRGVLDGSKKQHASAFFFLDKDVDELSSAIISSHHIAYTEHFNIENYFVIAGDLPRAAAISASLEVDDLRQWFGDLEAWRQSIAVRWQRWVELCLYATLHGISCRCHYSKNSLVHHSSGKFDQGLYSKALNELKQSSGLTATEFNQNHRKIRAIVKRYYSNRKHDALFNGKWYRIFVLAAVRTYAKNRAIRENFARSIYDTLVATIQFEGKWGEGLRRPLNRLVRHVVKFKLRTE
jgi:hypothetical protein